ncbi:MAG: hypothetical protein PWQ57_1457 [Desulfovibrionales bacterium]|jgi:cytidylate kinase|nr:hypothetical protein [Desulfovibrionales bacterium]
MPIVTIARNPYSRAGEIARRVARQLGYECVGPQMVAQACMELSLQNKAEAGRAPRLLELFSQERERSAALYRAAFYECMKLGDLVYYGLAGHVFLAGAPSVLHVRVSAPAEDRIFEAMRREGWSRREAQSRIQQGDEWRRAWTEQLRGKGFNESESCDIHVNLAHLSAEAAVEVIVSSARISGKDDGASLQQYVRDMALEAQAEARLLSVFPNAMATASNGELCVMVDASTVRDELAARRARQELEELPDMNQASVGVTDHWRTPFENA